MERIIAIHGHQNCGKTETINIIKELIWENGGISISTKLPKRKDDPETFEYNGKIISVCPGGDTDYIVRENFRYAYSKTANIIITATRTRGGSCEVVRAEAVKNGIDKIEWYAKSYDDGQSREVQMERNRELAEKVVGTI